MRGIDRAIGRHQMPTSGDLVFARERLHADQLQRIFFIQTNAFRQNRADAVLFLGHHSTHAKIVRSGCAVQLIARRMPLFDTHHAERFCAVRNNVELFALFHQFAHQSVAITRRYSDLKGHFARKRNTEQTRAQTATDGNIGAGHELKRLIRDVKLGVDDLLQKLARIRPSNRILRPSFRGGNQLHIRVRHQALTHKFHVLIDRASFGCGRCHNEMIFRQTASRAIIHCDTIFAQHQTIAHLANSQFRKRIAVEFVEERRRIRALHIDFSKRCTIAHTDRGTGCFDFAVYRLTPMGFALDREPLRAQPIAHFNKNRAALFRPEMRRRQTCRVELHPAHTTRQRANGHRRVRRAEDRCTHIGNTFACNLGHNRETAHVGCLALIRRHAQRRVALEVLNGFEPFLMRKLHVLDRHIVLLIQPRAFAALDIPKSGLLGRGVIGCWYIRRFDAKRVSRAFCTAVQGAICRQITARSACNRHARRQSAPRNKG